jgi:hypothetical protein
MGAWPGGDHMTHAAAIAARRAARRIAKLLVQAGAVVLGRTDDHLWGDEMIIYGRLR